FTVTAITLVIVVVFLPISLSTGLVSNILRQFTVTVMIATLLSLLVSFTVVPWLYSRYGKLEQVSSTTFFGRIIHVFERFLNNITNGIGNLLKWALANRMNKILTLVATVVLFIASIMLVGKGYIGTDFFPSNDKGEFYLQI